MKCFYHNDADGKCAAFWVALNVTACDGYPNNFEAINYRYKFPLETIFPNEQVYIVDYSINPDEMRSLLKVTTDVTWIDHHKTAIEKYTNFEYKIRGIRYDGIAGCMLTYCYIHHMTKMGEGNIKPFEIEMTYNAPYFTKLIADWDTWKFDYGNSTRYFHIAFESYDFSPGSHNWNMLLDGEENKLIEQGMVITRYKDTWASNYMQLGFDTKIEGYKAFAINLGYCNSEYFKTINNSKYDILMPFVFDGSKYTVSLYSETIDVSEIAKKFGGGGHKGASGFICKKLPFKETAYIKE